MRVDTKGRPRMLMLEVVEDLEGNVVVVRRVSGWSGVRGDERGDGGRRRYDCGHGEWMRLRIACV